MPATANEDFLSSEHTFFYDTQDPVTARSLADSIIGLEDLIERSAPLLSKLLGDLKIIEIKVEFTSIQIGSYKEDIIVRLLLGKGRKMEKKIDDLRKAFKLDDMGSKTVMGAVIGLLIVWAAWQYVKPGDPAQIHIENSFNSFGNELGMTGEDVRNIIEATMGNKKAQLQRDVSRITHPSGVKHTGTIMVDGKSEMTIPQDVLAHIPVGKADVDEADPIADLKGVDMVIRAGDLDSPDSGWAAIIPEIKDARIPLHVSPGVNRDRLVFGKYLKADVTVVYKTLKNGTKTPRRYILTKHIEPDAAPSGLTVAPP